MKRCLKIMMVFLLLFSLPKSHQAQDEGIDLKAKEPIELLEESLDLAEEKLEKEEKSEDVEEIESEAKEVSQVEEALEVEDQENFEKAPDEIIEDSIEELENEEKSENSEKIDAKDQEVPNIHPAQDPDKLEQETDETVEDSTEKKLENEEKSEDVEEIKSADKESSEIQEAQDSDKLEKEGLIKDENLKMSSSRQAVTTVRSRQDLWGVLDSISYPGKIMFSPELNDYEGLLSSSRETALIPSIGILSNAPLYVHYVDDQFALNGKLYIQAYSLSNRRKPIFEPLMYDFRKVSAGSHNLRKGLTLRIKAYDEKSQPIYSVSDPRRPLFLETSISGRADNFGVFEINKEDINLRFGTGAQSSITKNPDDIRRFLSAASMRLTVYGGYNAYKVNTYPSSDIALFLQYASTREVDGSTITDASRYESEYGRDLVHYVQFGKVQEDAEFTRAPVSQLSFKDGYYYLDSDIGIRSKQKDWMLVAVNKPGESLEGEACDCDWVRYFNLTDLYREKIEAGEDVFDIDWSERLGNVSPVKNHAFELYYHLIDPKNLSQEAVDTFLWNERNSEEAFNEVFKAESIQKTSLRSIHYFDLSLSIEASNLYRENIVSENEIQWAVEEYIESEFLVDADELIMDENGQMKDYNLEVVLFSQNPYDQELIQEEACILMDGAKIDLDLEEKMVDGKKRYLHRFKLKKKLPSSCEGEAKELHFDEDYRYYLRANIQRKVEGNPDVYIRSGYRDIPIRPQIKIHRRLITAANQYEDQLIYIDDDQEVFDQEAFMAFYQREMEAIGRDVSYMGYVINVPNKKDASTASMVENEYLDLENMHLDQNKKHYLVFYASKQLMYSDRKNNFLSFHFPYLYRDENKNYYADVLTDTKITNPYFVLSNAHQKDAKESMTSIAVSMLPFKDSEGQQQDGFTLDLEIEVFGIRNWMFANMERGDMEADRTAFYEINLDQVNQEKKIIIENEEVLKEHIQVIALIAHDDYFEEGIENPEDPEGCPHHKKTRIHYQNPKPLKVNEQYRSTLHWTIQYTELKIKGGQ